MPWSEKKVRVHNFNFSLLNKLLLLEPVAILACCAKIGDPRLSLRISCRDCGSHEEIQDKKKIADHTFDCLETPFDDNDLGKLEIKTVPKVPTLGKVAPSQEIPGLQVTNDPFKKKTAPLGNARQKVKIAKLGVPSLDLSSLKNVKEYKDWYGYSQKLENAIRLMREKIESLENYKEMTELQFTQLQKEIESLKSQNKSLS